MDRQKQMTMKQTYELMLLSWNSDYLASTDNLAKQMRDTNDMQNIITALDKQVPKKVEAEMYFYGYAYYCPCCKQLICTNAVHNKDHYCSDCGQALDWSN